MTEEALYKIIDGIKCYDPDSAQQYLDYPSEGFDLTDKLESGSFWVRSRSRILQYILNKYSRTDAKTRFLELGCGTGYFLRNLTQKNNFELTGSDVYLAGLKYAKAQLSDAEFIQFNATVNRLEEGYDLIGAFDVIEHIEDDRAVIANVHHSLSKGGYFILTVPQYKFLWSTLDELVRHKRRYNRAELTAKLQEGGFEIVFQSSFVFALFPLMVATRLRDRPNAAKKQIVDENLEKRVNIPPVLNWLFDKIMHIDEFLIRCGISLPFGGSLLVVARKIT